MRLKMTALVASALAGFLYVSVPSASALPAPARSDVTVPNAKTGAITEEVRYRGRGYRGRGYRGYGGYGRGYGYRRYGYYGYRPTVLLRRLRRVRLSLLLSPAPRLRHLPRLLTAAANRSTTEREASRGLAFFVSDELRHGVDEPFRREGFGDKAGRQR